MLCGGEVVLGGTAEGRRLVGHYVTMIPGVLSSKLSVASSVVVSAATAFLDASQPQLLPSTTMEDDEPTPDSYIKLISADSTTFYLQRRIALQVDTIKAMLDGNFRESEEGVIRFPDIGDSALEKVVRYLHYKDKWSNSSARIPEFDIAPEEVSLELIFETLVVIPSLYG